LSNGHRYIGQSGKRDFEITSFEKYANLIREPKKNLISSRRTDAKSTEELIKSNELEDKATLQWRISLVLINPIIALIAVALSKTDHRRGRYIKMLPALLVYITYLVILTWVRDSIGNGTLPTSLGMWWVHGFFFILAVILLFGQDWLRGWRRPTKNCA
jgi:lipopolysaccharide export system permease protein